MNPQDSSIKPGGPDDTPQAHESSRKWSALREELARCCTGPEVTALARFEPGSIELLFSGFVVVLKPDGTYFSECTLG